MSIIASPTVSSTVGMKNVVLAPLTVDTEITLTYGPLQALAGAMEATVTPENADPEVQYADDNEFDVLYPDPQVSFKTKMADIPLAIQERIFGNAIDENGVLIRAAADKPAYFAVGFKSEKANGKYRYVWLYKVRAKPITETYATKEGGTITRQTGEVEWTAIKRTHDGYYQAVADEGENGFTTVMGATFLATVYAPTVAGEIEITTQPVDIAIASGAGGTLTIVAEVDSGAPDAYQWYKATGKSYDGATASAYAGNDGAALTIPTDIADNSTHYFFCKLSNAGSRDVYSDIVSVIVADGE